VDELEAEGVAAVDGDALVDRVPVALSVCEGDLVRLAAVPLGVAACEGVVLPVGEGERVAVAACDPVPVALFVSEGDLVRLAAVPLGVAACEGVALPV